MPTPAPETDDARRARLEAERVCAQLQNQMTHARELMDQSRRLMRALASEPRSFRRDD
jgi:hypothetical protein